MSDYGCEVDAIYAILVNLIQLTTMVLKTRCKNETNRMEVGENMVKNEVTNTGNTIEFIKTDQHSVKKTPDLSASKELTDRHVNDK